MLRVRVARVNVVRRWSGSGLVRVVRVRMAMFSAVKVRVARLRVVRVRVGRFRVVRG